jgi:isoamylase/glycogen operon protein
MIKALHKAKIEVILDIVFNHTGEGNERGPIISWKGFGDKTYYLKNQHGEYLNFSGCGNTLNCNHPVLADMIIESLRYLVTEMHVDGFRSDLASIFTRDQDGHALESSLLLERITQDPILAHTKLIAEPWDAAGLHQVGLFFRSSWTGPEQWMEWNDDFRTSVRHFIKGSSGYVGKFATKLCGSQDLYGNEGSPLNTVNYIACHDGFTLRDCVTYNTKHNEENGENNRDGVDHHDTWNCGFEGETKDAHIEVLRQKQMKNFCLALFVSLGIPMIHMGDEYGHTKHGNNNTWCQDNERNWFLWPELDLAASLVHFWKEMIRIRSMNPLLRRTSFLSPDDIIWHGKTPFTPDWSTDSHFIAYTLIDHRERHDLFIAFNAQANSTQVLLPDPPQQKVWTQIVNTALLPPQDILDETSSHKVIMREIKMAPFSSILLKAQSI